MSKKKDGSNRRRKGLATLAAASAAGMLMAGSCMTELQAISVGLEAAARQLDANSQHNDDITFGEWLLSELSDI